jgi:hypothetical protein
VPGSAAQDHYDPLPELAEALRLSAKALGGNQTNAAIGAPRVARELAEVGASHDGQRLAAGNGPPF